MAFIVFYTHKYLAFHFHLKNLNLCKNRLLTNTVLMKCDISYKSCTYLPTVKHIRRAPFPARTPRTIIPTGNHLNGSDLKFYKYNQISFHTLLSISTQVSSRFYLPCM